MVPGHASGCERFREIKWYRKDQYQLFLCSYVALNLRFNQENVEATLKRLATGGGNVWTGWSGDLIQGIILVCDSQSSPYR